MGSWLAPDDLPAIDLDGIAGGQGCDFIPNLYSAADGSVFAFFAQRAGANNETVHIVSNRFQPNLGWQGPQIVDDFNQGGYCYRGPAVITPDSRPHIPVVQGYFPNQESKFVSLDQNGNWQRTLISDLPSDIYFKSISYDPTTGIYCGVFRNLNNFYLAFHR